MAKEIQVTLQLELERIEKAAEGATYRNLGHAAASIRKDVISTIQPGVRPSPPGTPPHTKTKQLPRAIVYSVEGSSAVVGPRASFVGQSGEGHEFGGKYKDRTLPERAFMWPGLQRGAPRFASDWEGSIGE